MPRRGPFPSLWILDGKLAIPEPNLMKWGRWMEIHQRRLALSKIGGVTVSTIFLGIDHNFFGDDPLLFETLIFRGGESGEMQRCGTWEEMEKQHTDMVEMIRLEIKEKLHQ